MLTRTGSAIRGLPWSRLLLLLTFASLGPFATGVGPRPAGEGGSVVYDLVLYNAVHLGAALVCITAVLRARADRAAWAALAVAILLGVAGNLVCTLAIATMEDEPLPSIADLFYLLYYLPLYVTLVALIRAHVPRFHASMWLDGVVGALGAGAVSVAVLLGPALEFTEGDASAVLTSLACPVADVVLLAVLVAIGAILGLSRTSVFAFDEALA